MASLPLLTGGEAFDAQIFPLITKNNSQYRKRFHINNYSEFKKSFMSGGQIQLPQYRFLEDSKYSQKILNLENFRNDLIINLTIHPAVKKLYLNKIEEKRLLLELVRSAFLAQTDNEDGYTAAQSFKKITEEIFGAPESNVFNHLCQVINFEIESLDLEIKNQRAYKNIKNIVSGNNQHTIPSYINIAQNNTYTKLEYITDAEIIIDFFAKKMQQIGLLDWKVCLTDKPIGSFRVGVIKKTVFVPKSSVLRSRKLNRRLNAASMEALFNHEVLTHVVRSVNGVQSKLQLLSHGLAGYLKGEEGIATYREQLLVNHTDYSGGTMYFALGLAYGLDRNGEMRNFKQVYDILCDYFYIKYNNQDSGYKSKAYSTCCRIFVFTGNNKRQMVFTRDIVYRQGNIEINNLLKSAPKIKDYFDIGKFDPNNDEHLAALEELEIIPH